LRPAVRAEASNRSFRPIRSSLNTRLRSSSLQRKAQRALRQARRDPHRAQLHDTGPEEPEHDNDDETTVVINSLAFAGIGWHTTADALLANTAAAKTRAQRLTAREELSITS